jgi:hypothetical protein
MGANVDKAMLVAWGPVTDIAAFEWRGKNRLAPCKSSHWVHSVQRASASNFKYVTFGNGFFSELLREFGVFL